PAGAAVDDERLRVLGDLGVEVVEEHPERRLGRPGPRVELRAPRRVDVREVAAQRLDRRRDRSRGAHWLPASSRACSRSRWRQRHQLYAVATRKRSGAMISTVRMFPPVRAVTPITTPASTA